jgi:hypothetical protein
MIAPLPVVNAKTAGRPGGAVRGVIDPLRPEGRGRRIQVQAVTPNPGYLDQLDTAVSTAIVVGTKSGDSLLLRLS